MKLFEYEAKAMLRKHGVSIPEGILVHTPEEATAAYTALGGGDVVLKSQVLVGGRGKAGGIRFAKTAEEALNTVRELLSMTIKGERVKSVLIERKLGIASEIYLGVTWDRSNKSPVVVATSSGGMDVEEVAKKDPSLIHRMYVDASLGFEPFMGRELGRKIGLSGGLCQRFGSIASTLYQVFDQYDAELVESNPLAVTSSGELIAADARLNLADDALFRHPEFADKPDRYDDLSPLEAKAKKLGVQYVELEGSIGIIGNGAGLTMSTLDVVKYYGGEPANFLDAGGGSSESEFLQALTILSENQRVRLIFVNILAGITRCDDVARAIVKAKAELQVSKPFVIRLAGTNEEEGRRILKGAGFSVFSDMEEAAKEAVGISKR
jgi:succinyl-CoA synthetase beta subunit